MFVTILGRPGAGKTTLGRRLEERLGVPYVGGGQLLREYAAARRPGWEAVLRNLELRRDSPPELQLQVLAERLEQTGGDGGVLDGFPKTLELAELIDRKLPTGITVALYVDTPVELAEFRVSQRLVCDVCHTSFPSGSVELGDACPCNGRTGTIIRRPDDLGNSERRIRESSDALKLRTHYQADGRLAVLDGSLTIEPLEVAAIEAITARIERPSATAD